MFAMPKSNFMKKVQLKCSNILNKYISVRNFRAITIDVIADTLEFCKPEIHNANSFTL